MRILFAIVALLFLAQCSGLPGKIGITLELTPVEQPQKKIKWTEVAQGRWEGDSDPPPVLINGTPVDRNKWKHILLLKSGGASCTGALIGPRTILTAAHCAGHGKTITFEIEGKRYSAIGTHNPTYRTIGHDLLLGVIAAPGPPEHIPRFSVILEARANENTPVVHFGFGCIRPDGSGGNDGILRTGNSLAINVSPQRDIITQDKPLGAALCFGDSGGPSLVDGKVIGVNSRGNLRDTNWIARTDKFARSFFIDFATRNKVEICGLHDCEGSKENPPGKSEHILEDSKYRIIILQK